MWEWCDKLKLGKSSAFVKRDIRALPQTEAEFEADFFLDPEVLDRRRGSMDGSGDREGTRCRACGGRRAIAAAHGQLALRICWPTPCSDRNMEIVSGHAPFIFGIVPNGRNSCPIFGNWASRSSLSEDLPRFDEAVIEWMQETKKPPSADKIKAMLRKPFPKRKRTSFTDTMELMEWSDAMFKAAFPSRKNPVPPYDPDTSVAISLTAEELDAILTKTDIAKTKKLRPRLEAMAAEGKPIELDIMEWSSVLLSLCGARVKDESVSKQLQGIARKIADQLAQALGIDGPPSPVQ